jgi:hypothetical protein
LNELYDEDADGEEFYGEEFVDEEEMKENESPVDEFGIAKDTKFEEVLEMLSPDDSIP